MNQQKRERAKPLNEMKPDATAEAERSFTGAADQVPSSAKEAAATPASTPESAAEKVLDRELGPNDLRFIIEVNLHDRATYICDGFKFQGVAYDGLIDQLRWYHCFGRLLEEAQESTVVRLNRRLPLEIPEREPQRKNPAFKNLRVFPADVDPLLHKATSKVNAGTSSPAAEAEELIRARLHEQLSGLGNDQAHGPLSELESQPSSGMDGATSSQIMEPPLTNQEPEQSLPPCSVPPEAAAAEQKSEAPAEPQPSPPSFLDDTLSEVDLRLTIGIGVNSRKEQLVHKIAVTKILPSAKVGKQRGLTARRIDEAIREARDLTLHRLCNRLGLEVWFMDSPARRPMQIDPAVILHTYPPLGLQGEQL